MSNINIRILKSHKRDWESEVKSCYPNENEVVISKESTIGGITIQYIFLVQEKSNGNPVWFSSIPNEFLVEINDMKLLEEQRTNRNSMLIIIKRAESDFVIPFGYWSKLVNEPIFEQDFGIKTLASIKVFNHNLTIKRLENEKMDNGDKKSHSKNSPTKDVYFFDNFDGSAESTAMVIYDQKSIVFNDIRVIRANKKVLNFSASSNITSWIIPVLEKIEDYSTREKDRKQINEFNTLLGDNWTKLIEEEQHELYDAKVFKISPDRIWFHDNDIFNVSENFILEIESFDIEGKDYGAFSKEIFNSPDAFEVGGWILEAIEEYKKTVCINHCVNIYECEKCDDYNIHRSKKTCSEHPENICAFRGINILRRVKISQNRTKKPLKNVMHYYMTIKEYSDNLEGIIMLKNGEWKTPIKNYTQQLNKDIDELFDTSTNTNYGKLIWKNDENEFDFNKRVVEKSKMKNSNSNEQTLFLGDRVFYPNNELKGVELFDILDFTKKAMIHIKNTTKADDLAHLKLQIQKSIETLKTTNTKHFLEFLKSKNPHYQINNQGSYAKNYICKLEEGSFFVESDGKKYGCGLGIPKDKVDGRSVWTKNFKTIIIGIAQKSFKNSKITKNKIKNMSFFKKQILKEILVLTRKEGYDLQIVLIEKQGAN